MRMSHIYQPLLIRNLVDAGGSATVRQLALNFLSYDESQIIHYERTLKSMPIKVLSKHDVVSNNGEFISLATPKLSFTEKAEIKKICEQKIQDYIQRRGLSIWDYRLLNYDPIPDSVRYRVLSEANGRCALCGATSKERLLDVDHIIPRSKGGSSDYNNLQVLCSKCNRSKGNKDDKDFRGIGLEPIVKDCQFCTHNMSGRIVNQNTVSVAIKDEYPVTKGHTLIIPKRHESDYFKLSQKEILGIHDLVKVNKLSLSEIDPKITGFNVGVNVGKDAGQTIFHVHLHLIPRRNGDLDEPRGGVRGVIPDKMISEVKCKRNTNE